MKGLLVRVGIDQAYGGWNAPCDPETGDFVFVPIPEGPRGAPHPGCERPYDLLTPALGRFASSREFSKPQHVRLPAALLGQQMHLDPDFDEFTYGNRGDGRGDRFAALTGGDVIAFFAGLRSVRDGALVYAIIGLFVVDEVVSIRDVPESRRHENAHTRKIQRGLEDVIVRARRSESGRLSRVLPIGEWRSRAYRVRHDVLDAWGGLGVNDGYIQRSAVPPWFEDASRFYRWFISQRIDLVERNW